MPQYDAVLRFASLAAAKADPVVQQYYDAIMDRYRDDLVIPNLQVWRVSQDVGDVHTYDTGFCVLISAPRVIAAVRDHSALRFAVDRDKANARQAGAVLRLTVSNAVLQDTRFSPVFAGCDYPWGAWT